MNSRKVYCLSLLFLLIFIPVGKVSAQVMHITGNIYKTMKGLDGGHDNRMPLSVPVYVFDNKSEANRQANVFRSKNKGLGEEVKITSNATVNPDYDGHFETEVSAKGALLIINDNEVKVVPITSALTYEIVFSDGAKSILLANTTVIGKQQGVNILEMKPIDDGPNLHWDVTIRLPEWYTSDHSRLIFQPMAIDCQTEDTIQYLEPLVYEGKSYHRNQIRRKSFDYDRNDSLHSYYISDKPTTDSAFIFRWQTTYLKPDPARSYKWGSILRIAD